MDRWWTGGWAHNPKAPSAAGWRAGSRLSLRRRCARYNARMSGETGREKQAGTLYDRLTAINREAFEMGHYDIAYHALAGALSYAETDGTQEQLRYVEQTAMEQLKFIDMHAPTYHHSTASAA